MTPRALAQRLAALDWSGTSLQHQLAVACAVATLEGLPCEGPYSGSNVIDLAEIFRREHLRAHALPPRGGGSKN